MKKKAIRYYYTSAYTTIDLPDLVLRPLYVILTKCLFSNFGKEFLI
jgi:hypothetical protein